MIIKVPIVYDISHYKEVIDFNEISPKPELIITKATEGNSFVDSKFVRFFDGMKSAGILRGCYHFHRKISSPVTQAAHFINTIKNHVTTKDLLVLDVEEGGETALQLQQFIEVVKEVYPNNTFLIYSRKNLLDPITMNTDQRNFFRKIPVWTAGYPFNPDYYATVPAGYVPDQTKYGPVWLWQYSSTAIIEGIQGSVDLNWIHPDLYAIIKSGGTTEPPPTNGGSMTEIVYANGVTVITGRLNDSDYRTTIIPYAAILTKTYVYSPGRCIYAENVPGYDFVANFVSFTQCKPNLGLRINENGVVKEHEPYHNYNPYLALDGIPKISHVYRDFRNFKTVSQAFRYIIENSVKNPNANADWNILNPLRLAGTKPNGDLVITMVKGRESGVQRGWSLHEAATYGLSLGCNMMVDADGGSSVQETLTVDGLKSLHMGIPINQRGAVPVFLAIKFKTPLTTGTTPPTPPVDEWPEYFHLEKPDGTRARYNKE